jgi:type II secretory pathway component PulF
MTAFRYQAVQADGAPVEGVLQADHRRAALQTLARRGLYPSRLEATAEPDATQGNAPPAPRPASSRADAGNPPPGFLDLLRNLWLTRVVQAFSLPASRLPAGTLPATNPSAARRESAQPSELTRVGSPTGGRVRRKEISALTRELSALLGAAIPIPQALDGLADAEANPALRAVLTRLAETVRKGAAFSTALEEHPRLFSRLYVSMVRVGEEAGALPRVMTDLADLLEHEDEVRSEVLAAIAYPAFVLGFGVFTVMLLLTVVLPRLFDMMREMLPVLPLPTLILLQLSEGLGRYWPWCLLALGGLGYGVRRALRSPRGMEAWDGLRLRLPLVGPVFRAAALGRFARTLGTLARSGVSLLPALRIVEETLGNRVLARQVARVAEETRGGDSLATPLRKLGLFPKGVIQMIEVGEETGQLDDMLLKIAVLEERHLRARTRTLISLLAPALILVVGALVGFMVIAILLPIFRLSRAVY